MNPLHDEQIARIVLFLQKPQDTGTPEDAAKTCLLDIFHLQHNGLDSVCVMMDRIMDWNIAKE